MECAALQMAVSTVLNRWIQQNAQQVHLTMQGTLITSGPAMDKTEERTQLAPPTQGIGATS